MNEKSTNNIIPWLISCIAIAVAVLLYSRGNNSIVKQLQREKQRVIKESIHKVDSLESVIISKDVVYNEKMLILARSKDSLQELYDKSKIELDEIKIGISDYLTASDSVRFSTFRRIILTEMGQIQRN